MIVSPYYRNEVIVFSERYERPDPISLPSERTHGNGDVVNQSDGKPEPGTPFLSPSPTLSYTLFLFPLFSSSDLLCVSRVLFTGRSFPSRAIRDRVRTNSDTPIAINCDNK